MNFIDILLIIPIVYGAVKGFSRGFLIELATLLGFFIGIFMAMKYASVVGQFLVEQLQMNSSYSHIAGWGVTFIASLLVVSLIGWIATKLIDLLALGIVNKMLGTFLGMVKYTLLVIIIMIFVNKLDGHFHFITSKQKTESLLYQPFMGIANNIYNIFDGI